MDRIKEYRESIIERMIQERKDEWDKECESFVKLEHKIAELQVEIAWWDSCKIDHNSAYDDKITQLKELMARHNDRDNESKILGKKLKEEMERLENLKSMSFE